MEVPNGKGRRRRVRQVVDGRELRSVLLRVRAMVGCKHIVEGDGDNAARLLRVVRDLGDVAAIAAKGDVRAPLLAPLLEGIGAEVVLWLAALRRQEGAGAQ